MALPPDARLVASLRRTVEPLVHAPDAVHAARIGGVRVIHDAILEYESAHSRPVARVRLRVGSAVSCKLDNGLRCRRRIHRMPATQVVVFDFAITLLRLGERN